MSRQPGEPMRKLLALHNEWLVANGYPLQVSREKKNKTSQFKAQARATTYRRNLQKQKHRRKRLASSFPSLKKF